MNITAAILWEQGKPISVEAAELDPPGPGEVLVEMKAAGVCHSDFHPARGDWPIKTPVVLGHEGAGIVREIGSGVTSVDVGDHVVLCWAPACGVCECCRDGHAALCDRLERTTYRNRLPSGASRLRARGETVSPFLSTACFASHAVVAAEGAVPVPRDVPFDALATLGCAVVTGVGAVRNAARLAAGSHVAVIGTGGVGLNVIQGAVLARAERIVAVDVHAAPLVVARQFGATDTIESTAGVADAIRSLTNGRGADVVFDTVGLASTIADAISATRKGGTVVLTGLARIDGQASIATFPFVMQEKRLIGSVYGSASPARDIVGLVDAFRHGQLKLLELVTRRYRLEDIDTALTALGCGAGARGIVQW
jgi:S-(hydroxymethyl)glutathione dehydrogenase/alcohol dehydrogenase